MIGPVYTMADYLLDQYGQCTAAKCLCRDPEPWLGRACPQWKPWDVRTYDELKAKQAAVRAVDSGHG